MLSLSCRPDPVSSARDTEPSQSAPPVQPFSACWLALCSLGGPRSRDSEGSLQLSPCIVAVSAIGLKAYLHSRFFLTGRGQMVMAVLDLFPQH